MTPDQLDALYSSLEADPPAKITAAARGASVSLAARRKARETNVRLDAAVIRAEAHHSIIAVDPAGNMGRGAVLLRTPEPDGGIEKCHQCGGGPFLRLEGPDKPRRCPSCYTAEPVAGGVAWTKTDPPWRDAMAAEVARVADGGEAQREEPKPPAKPNKRAAEHTDDGAPDWERLRQQIYADHDGPELFRIYQWQDAKLVARGQIPTAPWWRKTILEFIESELPWLVAMVGRGGAKSTNLEKLLLLFVIWLRRTIPPGQPWAAPFLSVVEKDAYRRIVEIKQLLESAYSVEAKIRDSSIQVADCSGNAINVMSAAATIAQMSGPTTVTLMIDEAAKMPTGTAANADSEVLASAVGTSRDLIDWRGVRCSSAFSTRGAHFANCMEGTNSQNYVATIGAAFIDAALAGYEDVARWEQAQGNGHGAAQIRAFAKTLHPGSPNVPTWVARPTLTALQWRLKLETMPKDDPALEGLSRFDYWIREYGSMPLSREGGADFAAQCMIAADITARLAGKGGSRMPVGVAPSGLLADPRAKPGDARYAGPPPRVSQGRGGWRNRRAF